MPSDYVFRPMTADDLPLVKNWLMTPHVSQWWRDVALQFELVSADLEDEAMEQFIVTCGERPFAYLQCYDPADWGNPFGQQPNPTRGVDQFIGEADMINRGHGSAFMREFSDKLLAAGVLRVLTDPDPKNLRAIRAYEKAGFQKDRLIDTSDGPALLMVRNK